MCIRDSARARPSAPLSASASTHADAVARVLAGTARRIRRLLEERAGDEEDALARDESLLALLAVASLRTRIATGSRRGESWRRRSGRAVGVHGVRRGPAGVVARNPARRHEPPRRRGRPGAGSKTPRAALSLENLDRHTRVDGSCAEARELARTYVHPSADRRRRRHQTRSRRRNLRETSRDGPASNSSFDPPAAAAAIHEIPRQDLENSVGTREQDQDLLHGAQPRSL